MKKNMLTACLATVFALVTTACHEVIFYEIRQEVKLADAQVSGDINSIVRFGMDGKEYLFVQSGNIYYKELKPEPTMTEPYEGQWTKANKGDIGNGIVFRLAADESYLYALAVRIEEDEDEGENYSAEQTLYCSTNGSEWKKIDLTLPSKGPNTLFCTNSPNPVHRKAFLNAGGTVYALSGESATECDTGGVTNPRACTWFAGDVIFSASGAATTNETAVAEAEQPRRYESSGNKILTYSTTAGEPIGKDVGYTIYALACTSDFLLAGTDNGLIYFGLDDNGLPNGTTDSGTNVSSTLSSYYEVHNVLAVDPSLPAKAGDIYGTTVFEGTSSNTGASSDNQGLWAYYPGPERGGRDGRGWNRE